MADTTVTDKAAATVAEGAAKAAEGGAKPAVGDTERMTVNGADMVKGRDEIIAAAQKQFAGENLLQKHAAERKQWLEDQAALVSDAKFGQSFKKAVTEHDPKALREVLLGFGKFSDAEVDQSVNAWLGGRGNVAAERQGAQGGEADGQQVVGKIVEALQVLDKRNKDLTEQLAALKKDTSVLDRRELIREDAEFDVELEGAIKADEFHGEFAGSKPYLSRIRKVAKGILLRRVQNGQGPPDAAAAKEALQEARALVEDVYDGVRDDDGIRGFALPSSRGARDLHQSRKAPERVSVTDPGYVDNLAQRLEAWAKDSARAARR